MANKEWLELFPSALCNVLAAVKSDHSPLNISIFHNSEGGIRKQKIFRYEAAWDLREDSALVLEQAWKRNGMGGDLAESLRVKLESCQKGLTRWVKNHNQDEKKKTTRTWAKISRLQDRGDGEHITLMKQLQKDAELSLAENDMKWRQRAKQH
ncbi:uncharacterized protein LOC122296634 [Carya illinoinensis]|uniref:uncharacterized protein LOC122296634 n=1 Tax=Carya illinoinensis TaxID=32201 RepID=UPI001C71DDA1|nr:uncharacterized protein LOC122296634 [Carya illinoinensis]